MYFSCNFMHELRRCLNKLGPSEPAPALPPRAPTLHHQPANPPMLQNPVIPQIRAQNLQQKHADIEAGLQDGGNSQGMSESMHREMLTDSPGIRIH